MKMNIISRKTYFTASKMKNFLKMILIFSLKDRCYQKSGKSTSEECFLFLLVFVNNDYSFFNLKTQLITTFYHSAAQIQHKLVWHQHRHKFRASLLLNCAVL